MVGGDEAERPRNQAETHPSSSSSDITTIWHCLQLSHYGQFESVTCPEIMVIWIHL